MVLGRMKSALLTVIAASLLAAAAPVRAQPVLNRVLKGSSAKRDGECSTIMINFNRRISYQSHFPMRMGQSVAIRLQMVGGTQDREDDLAPEVARREALSTGQTSGSGVRSASLDLDDGSNPVLRIQFDAVMRYEVRQGGDFRSIELRVWPAKGSGCGPSGDVGDTDKGKSAVGGSLSEARRELKSGDINRAIALLAKLAGSGDRKTAMRAQELLGLARERNDQFAHAKAEYERYLKKYPDGDGAARVRQRLKALIAARNEQELKRQQVNRAEKQENAASRPAPEDQAGPKSDAEQTVLKDGKGEFRQAEDETQGKQVSQDSLALKKSVSDAAEEGWQWQTNGSVSQFYYRTDNFAGSNPWQGEYENRQSELVTSGDLSVYAENENVELTFRFSGYNEQGLQSDDKGNRSVITAAYSDIIVKDTGLSATIGRRRSSSGGVYGRYDGARLSYEFETSTTIHAIVGSPVYYRNYDKVFPDQRYFFGGSVEQKFLDDTLAVEAYYLEQDVGSILDRRAVGGEVRYSDGSFNGFGGVDYDIFFEEFNSAFANLTYVFDNGSSIYSTVDFRRVPFLLTSNALIGQTADDLSSLVDIFSLDEVYQFALDRTATAKTAMIGYSHKIDDDWQLILDATWADYSGTTSSGGVDAIPSPGEEIYVGARLNGANLFTEQDYLSIGLRYMNTGTYDMGMADISYRRYLDDDWRILARGRLTYREWDDMDRQQFVFIPSVRLNYQMDKNWSFETEVGARWETNMGTMGAGDNTDLLVTAGYRYQF